jgi:hypothetical protein
MNSLLSMAEREGLPHFVRCYFVVEPSTRSLRSLWRRGRDYLTSFGATSWSNPLRVHFALYGGEGGITSLRSVLLRGRTLYAFTSLSMAEREGFEPSVELVALRRFSKPLPSASRSPLLYKVLIF